MKNSINNIMKTGRNALNHIYMAHRQAESFEQFMQERAGVFQVTETKEQAMFWSQGLLAR
ncbi:MAG: hypothetical protein HFE91_06645 [Acutalibacter sp.]|jgi:hypothetical protein|uniref:hypothetical protein n=1 Tax=unclassified Acutalibacter TaxID=2620728 RepID=UPI00216F9D70|nr:MULTISPECIES: hypothetical protein [unclassified Acutalibacter]MCI9225129.1 hypothetical protein [Acutalibacter sp.]